MSRLILLAILLLSQVFLNAQLVFHAAFNGQTGDLSSIDSVSTTPILLFNRFDRPERTEGVAENALRLDGYTTHGEAQVDLSGATRALTLEAWYTTEAFSTEVDDRRQVVEDAAIVSQQGIETGFALEIGSFGEVYFIFHADGIRYELTSPIFLLTHYTWNHLVGTVDLNAQTASLYVNGLKWAEWTLPTHTSLTYHTGPLLLGKNSFDDYAFNLSVTHANGALDEVKIYANSLSENDILNQYLLYAPEPLNQAVVYADFEGEDYGAWTKTGDAFGAGPALGTLPNQNPVTAYEGARLVNTFFNGDITTGTLLSPTFLITRDLISFLIGGGYHPGGTEMRLLVDGNIVKTATGNNDETMTPRTWDVHEFIGQEAQLEIIDSKIGGWGHINIDYIVFEDKPALLEADLLVDPILRHGDDYLRPRYHPMPATAWANENYGLIYFDNQYHVFFQKNPSSLYINFMHWGHLVSDDLVDWTETRIPLAPSKGPGHDRFGIWSGTSVLDKQGMPALIYTGVSTAKASIGLAFPTDTSLLTWQKSEQNPVVFQSPPGLNDFRDPYVWRDGASFYMIVGSGKAEFKGGYLPLYKSADLEEWTYLGPMYERSDRLVSGRFWEMPAFIKLNEQNEYALIVNAHIPQGNGFIAEGLYWIGKWENETFTPYHQDPRSFEATRYDLLSPAIGRDKEGRIIYSGIIPETRSEASQLAAGWRQTFSITRVLRLMADTTLGHYPHPNLCRYRENEVSITDRQIKPGMEDNLALFSGNQIELKVKLLATDSARFDLKLLQSESGDQYTRFGFDLAKHEIKVDRSQSSTESLWGSYRTKDYIFDYEDTIHIHVFIDRSVIELFVDNTLTFSSRVYPREDSKWMDLVVSKGAVTLVEAQQWDVKSFGSPADSEVCEPRFVPDTLRKPAVISQPPIDSPTPPVDTSTSPQEDFNLYPNPFSDRVYIHTDIATTQIKVSLTDMTGRSLQNFTLSEPDWLDLAHYAPGAYFVEVRIQDKTFFRKVLILQ